MRALVGWLLCEFGRHDPVVEEVPMDWIYIGDVWVQKSYGQWVCARCTRTTNSRGRDS